MFHRNLVNGFHQKCQSGFSSKLNENRIACCTENQRQAQCFKKSVWKLEGSFYHFKSSSSLNKGEKNLHIGTLESSI